MKNSLFVLMAVCAVTIANVGYINPENGFYYSVKPNCENTKIKFSNGKAQIPSSCIKSSNTIELYAKNSSNTKITSLNCSNIANTVSQIWVSYAADTIACQSF